MIVIRPSNSWILNFSPSPSWAPTANVPGDPRDFTGILDLPHDRIVVFGGQFGSGALSSTTWFLNLSSDTWSSFSSGDTIPFQRRGQLVFDPLRDRVLLLGQPRTDPTSIEAWSFSPTTGLWSLLAIPGPRPGYASHGTAWFGAYDAVRDRVILYGNFSTGSGSEYQLWELLLS